MTDRKAWNQKEDMAILSLVKQYGIKKWTIVAEKMKEVYGLFGRSGKQCRERYHNHLDPTINKDPWGEEEERVIFIAHKEHGNKWAEIAKLLPESLLFNSQKKLEEDQQTYWGQKHKEKGTQQIKDIKPGVLSKIFILAEKNPHELKDDHMKKLCIACKGLQDSILEFAQSKQKLQLKDQLNEDKFKQLIEKIMEFNALYTKQRESRLKMKRKNANKRKKHRLDDDDDDYTSDYKYEEISNYVPLKRSTRQSARKRIVIEDLEDLPQQQSQQQQQQQQQQHLQQQQQDSILETYLEQCLRSKKGPIFKIIKDEFEIKQEDEQSSQGQFEDLHYFNQMDYNTMHSPNGLDHRNTPVFSVLTPKQIFFQKRVHKYEEDLPIDDNGMNKPFAPIVISKQQELNHREKTFDNILSQLKQNIDANSAKYQNTTNNDMELDLDNLDMMRDCKPSPGSLRIGISPSSFRRYRKKDQGGIVNFMMSSTHCQDQ